MNSTFWISRIIFYALVLAITSFCGYFVKKGKLKVSYSRKIEHFSLFLIPPALHTLMPFGRSFATVIVDMSLMVLFCLIHIEPVRRNSRLIELSFMCVDRPEDRPNTLFWMTSQIFAGYLAIFVAVTGFHFTGVSTDLIHVPLLITALGDGLAEPVGVTFGRHKYSVRPFLGGTKLYTRSLEGSACVLFVGLLVILAFGAYFSPTQLAIALLTVPTVMTLAEAFSPHTWDMPFLIASGAGTIAGINFLV